MGREENVFLVIGAYADKAGAVADYAVVKELHAAGVIGGLDAAVITKDAEGKVHVNKDESSTRKGAWGGLGVGALIGILFPPSLIATAGLGALVGGVGGHLWKGMSRADMKELGELLDENEAALVVMGDWRLEERLDELTAHARKREAKELRTLERSEMQSRLGEMMSGQGTG